MREAGTKEIEGPLSEERILKYAEDTGFVTYSNDDTAWCSLFVNWVAHKSNHERSKSLAARSWLKVGQFVDAPEPGDIVIFWRERVSSWKGHVGIFVGYSRDSSRIYCLGGNQVSISAYPSERLLGFRRLKPLVKIKFNRKNIAIGASGLEVIKLQNALNQIGFSPGTVDGVFGSKTKSAVQIFQSSFDDLDVTGVVNKETKARLIELLSVSG